jgi:hypothetical protein
MAQSSTMRQHPDPARRTSATAIRPVTSAIPATVRTAARTATMSLPKPRRVSPFLLTLLFIVAIAGAAWGGWYFATNRMKEEAPPEVVFHRMTFRRGEVRSARFGPDGITRAGMALGLFHSLQYHRLMWFHNKNRYQTENAREKHGFAAVLGQKFGYYFAAAVGLYWIADILPQALFPMLWLQASLWGIAFMHYLLDSKIWRVRDDKELAAALLI